MALNSSGPISLGGTTAGQSIELENGGNGTTQISLNDTAVRNLAGVPSGQIIMPTNFYGKSNRVSASITISANTSNYTLNTAKVTGYSAGKTDVTLTINSGVYVSSSSTGTPAFIVDTSWASGDTVTIVNNGTIVGRGGNGGRGGGANGNPSAGSSGGTALNVLRSTSINNGSGRIAGGGGGAGGGNGWSGWLAVYDQNGSLGGGGGGGGIGVSSGGAGGLGSAVAGGVGENGTLTTAGNGGGGGSSPPDGAYASGGGTGGGYGATASGGNGGSGSGGACVVGNTYITWIAVGTRNGGIS